MIRRLRALPPQAWQRAVIDTPKRRHQRVRFLDESIRLPDYEGAIRQLAVDGLGREQPTLFLSHNLEETARALIIRDAGRNGVEDGLGTSVNFFHLDCLASEVRLNVDLDVAMTVLAHGCSRWLAHHLKGFDCSAPKRVFRKFVATAGSVTIDDRRIVVRLDRRSHNPILREAGLDRQCPPIPWLNNLPVACPSRLQGQFFVFFRGCRRPLSTTRSLTIWILSNGPDRLSLRNAYSRGSCCSQGRSGTEPIG